MTPLLFQLIYAVWVVGFAFINKQWIKYNAGFRHWVNALAHLSEAGFSFFHFGWQYGIAILFIVRVVFDGMLSVFRGLSFDYVSPKPDSLVDQMEKRLFGNNGMIPKIIYLLITVALNLL